MKNTMENIKTYVIITAIAIVGILGGCAVEKEDEGKVRDLEFTVVAQEEQPDALRDVIGEKKEKPFQISYTRGEELYIAVGMESRRVVATVRGLMNYLRRRTRL